MKCPSCQGEVLEIDVKCEHCGAALGATGAHRMIGQTVINQYELVDVLGQGGMSVVFKARHTMTGQEVALKILPPELAAHSQVKSRFLEEAKALAALDHPNIVHLYNFGQENGSFVLAMQYVQGKTWERAILERQRLDWKASCRIGIDVLKALEYAHGRGVVHRDMKPSNVLVRESDGAATVMDFGIAKMTTSTKLTATGQTMGTVRYMSPEQVRGQEVDLRTDIYSLGATLYESLVGDTPFDGATHFEIMTKHLSDLPKPPSRLGIQLPASIEGAIMRSLAKKADDRFENARDFRKILEQALRDGDAGIVETNRFARDILGTGKETKDEKVGVKRSALATAPTARSSTATDLADELEPGTSASPVVRRRRPLWPFIALAVLLLGGAAAGGIVLMSSRGGGGFEAKNQIAGVTLAAGKKFDANHYVETTSRVTPTDVYAAYIAALAEIQSFEPNVTGERDVVQEIVAVPETALCLPSIARANPDDPCLPSRGFTTAIGKRGRQLLIRDDPGALVATMRAGVAGALCDFQFAFLDPAADPIENAKRTEQVCDMTKRFVGK